MTPSFNAGDSHRLVISCQRFDLTRQSVSELCVYLRNEPSPFVILFFTAQLRHNTVTLYRLNFAQATAVNTRLGNGYNCRRVALGM